MLMKKRYRGFTLTEILISGVIAGVLVLALTQTDMTRVRIQQDLRQQEGAAAQQQQAMVAALHISKHLEAADRMNVLSPSNIQLRIALADDVDNPASYRWDEYRLSGNNLEYFSDATPPCAAPMILSEQITGLTFAYTDEAIDPPGGPVFAAGPEDNNVITYTLTWDDGARSQQFVGEITSRNISYSNIFIAGNSDSGRGLSAAAPAIPAAC